MRRQLMKNGKNWAMLAALTYSSLSYAATTGSLQLRGNVPDILSIEVNAKADATNLDLQNDQTDLKIASVLERSNSSTGYTLTIDSANDGQLVRNGGSETFTYSMKYDGSSVDLSSSDSFNNSASAAVAVNKDVTISYTGQDADTMIAGDYEDTVTFSIAAN